MPESKMFDINMKILSEIVFKLNNEGSNTKDFLPFNKSILTRIMYEQLRNNNFLVLTHLTKKTLTKYLKLPLGTPKGMFSTLIRLGFTKIPG